MDLKALLAEYGKLREVERDRETSDDPTHSRRALSTVPP
jgi:hypothetical protein